MLNYYELMELIKDSLTIDELQTIRETFNGDFVKEYKKISFNNTTRKAALKSFLANNDIIYADSENSYLWATQTAIIYSNSFDLTDDDTNGRQSDIYKRFFKSVLENQNKKPVDFHFKESLAIARALSWTAGKDPDGSKAYHINIDGNYYDFNLVYSLTMLFADNKINYGGIEAKLVPMQDSPRNMLWLQSKYGIAALLPTILPLHTTYNVDFNNYCQYENALDDLIKAAAIKTA